MKYLMEIIMVPSGQQLMLKVLLQRINADIYRLNIIVGLGPGTVQFYGAPGMGKAHLCHLLRVVLYPPFQVTSTSIQKVHFAKQKSNLLLKHKNWTEKQLSR